MNFVWILGSGSRWDNNEIRYSMRSVLLHHPNAEVMIVGEKPVWYDGPHHYMPDENRCPYVNVWRKIEWACWRYHKFVQMDDDFYLNEPMEIKHYYKGLMRSFAAVYRDRPGLWARVVTASDEAIPGSLRHCLHVPLPIISDSFLHIAEQYPQRLEAPSLVPRQIYCAREKAIPKESLSHDVKIVDATKLHNYKRMPFFSIGDRAKKMKPFFDEQYPKPTPYEADK